MKKSRTEAAPVTAVDVRRAAMDLLARREHSYRELFDKLQRMFGTPVPPPDAEDGPPLRAVIGEALDRLRAEGLQSDARYAESFVVSRAQRLYGPVRIRIELRERGLDEAAIEAAFAGADVDWHGNLQKLLFDKFGPKPAADIRERARRMRFLQYRGFRADDIRRSVGEAGD